MGECKPAVCRPALKAIGNAAIGQLSSFSTTELSRLLWALGSQGCLRLRQFSPALTADLRRPGRLPNMDHDSFISVITVLAWMMERAVWEHAATPSVGKH